MAGAFESLGSNFETAIAGYAEDMSGALIGSLTPIISTCVILYFTLKGYLYMSGRAEGAISDTVITAFKIALISSIALNTGNFISDGIGFINGVEDLLLSALPSSTPLTSVWSSVDELWSNVESGIAAIFNLMSEIDFGFGNIGKALLHGLLLIAVLIAFLAASALLVLASLGVIIVAKLSLVIILGFGPLFLCTLMFPITRAWFDGWLKACLTPVFTMVVMAGLLSLLNTIFQSTMSSLVVKINEAASGNAEAFAPFALAVMTFLIMCLALATLIRAIPTLASGMVGGMGISAVGLGAMLSGASGGALAAANAGKAVLGYAVHNKALAQNSMSHLGSSGRVGSFAAGQAAGLTTAIAGTGVRVARTLGSAVMHSKGQP